MKRCEMRVDLSALRQQSWRAGMLFEEMDRYARSIGCTVWQDEVVCHTDAQARKLAAWWRERTT